MIAWKVVYGAWVTSPMPLAHNWLRPDWARVLVATDRSLLYWTPLTLLPIIGYVLCLGPTGRSVAARSIPREPLRLLCIAFVAQVYLMASLSGGGVYLGSAFGFRQLTEAVVLLAPGLALLLESAAPIGRRRLIAACFVLSVWNVLLLAQYHGEVLPRAAGADFSTLLKNLVPLFQTWWPGTGVLLTGPALLAGALLRHRAAWERPAVGN
jgi:hypothetical protein